MRLVSHLAEQAAALERRALEPAPPLLLAPDDLYGANVIAAKWLPTEAELEQMPYLRSIPVIVRRTDGAVLVGNGWDEGHVDVIRREGLGYSRFEIHDPRPEDAEHWEEALRLGFRYHCGGTAPAGYDGFAGLPPAHWLYQQGTAQALEGQIGACNWSDAAGELSAELRTRLLEIVQSCFVDELEGAGRVSSDAPVIVSPS